MITRERLAEIRKHFEPNGEHEGNPICLFDDVVNELLDFVDELWHQKSALHRRLQRAESDLLKNPFGDRQPNTWASSERRAEAEERDRMMAAVGSAQARSVR